MPTKSTFTLRFILADLLNPFSRRILTFLIPLRILRGHLPSRELMQRFPVLDELYAPFMVRAEYSSRVLFAEADSVQAAIRTGDIASYDRALEKWERRLVELNLWLTLEKARELCVRGLFRRV